MPGNTPVAGFYKKDPVTDGNDTFNIVTMLNENWDKADELLGRPFFLAVPTYDAANDRIVCTLGKGIAELFNGDTRVIVEKAADTIYYINTPVINTTYYLFLQQDGTFTHNTTGVVPPGAVLLWEVATGATVGTLTKTDRRAQLSGAGAKFAAHLADTAAHNAVRAGTDNKSTQEIKTLLVETDTRRVEVTRTSGQISSLAVKDPSDSSTVASVTVNRVSGQVSSIVEAVGSRTVTTTINRTSGQVSSITKAVS